MIETLDDAITRVVATVDFGTPSAAKRGRNPKFPYVPIVKHTEGGPSGNGWTHQLLGLAYVTREEAVERAQKHIDAARASLARQLTEPRMRALRESYGLPREIQ